MDTSKHKFEIAPRSEPEVNQVLARLSVGGSLDVRQVAEQDVAVLFDLFNHSYDQLDAEQQLQLLESLLAGDLIGDREMLDKVRQMQPEQKKKLGQFIGRVIKPGTAVRSFHECWEDLDYADRHEFEQEFLKKHPEHALMVAPFVKLNLYKTTEEKASQKKIRTITERYFNGFDRIEELFDVMLDYYNQHRGDPYPPYHTQGNIKANILDHRIFALSRWSELLETGLFSIEELKKLLPSKNDFGWSSVDSTKFSTEAEKAEENELLGLLKKRGEGEDIDQLRYKNETEIANEKIARRLTEIRDTAKLRRAKAWLHGYTSYRDHLENTEEFISELNDLGLPILTGIDSLGMDKTEAAELIKMLQRESGSVLQLGNLADLKSLLEFDRRHPGEPNLENLIISYLVRDIAEQGAGWYTARDLVMNIETILPSLSEDNQRKLIEVITKRDPALWLYNLDFALDNQLKPADELFGNVAQTADIFFLEVYPRAERCLLRREKAGKADQFHVADLRVVGRRIFEAHPERFNTPTFKRVYTPEERQDFFARYLQIPISREFLRALSYADQLQLHRDPIRKALLEQPGLFEAAVENSSILKKIIPILGVQETIRLSLEYLHKIDLENFFENQEILIEIIGQPRLQQRLLSRLVEIGEDRRLGELMKNIEDIYDLHLDNLRLWKENFGKAQLEIKQLQHTFRNRRATKEDRIDARERLKQARSKLIKLQADQPERGIAQAEAKLKVFLENIKQAIHTASKSNRFFVFEASIRGLESLGLEDLVRDNIDEYTDIYPATLANREYSHRKEQEELRKILSPGQFEGLCKKHIRLLAFRRRYGQRDYLGKDIFPPEIIERLKQVNSYNEVESSTNLSSDFYDAMLARASELAFFPLYEKELRQVAREQQEQNGQQRDATKVYSPGHFNELIDRLGILENCPLATENRQAIIDLSPIEQKELLNMLEFMALNNLDQGLRLDLRQMGWGAVKEQLMERITVFVQKVLELETEQAVHFEDLTSEGLQALAIFYHRSCQRRANMKLAFRDFINRVINGDYLSWRAWGKEGEPVTAESAQQRLAQLKAESLLPAGISLEQYRVWLADEQVNLEESLGYNIHDVQSGIRDVLDQVVVDGHIEPELVQVNGLVLDAKYEKLITPLQVWTARQKELKQRFVAAKKAKKDKQPQAEITAEEQAEFRDLQNKVNEYFFEYGEELKLLRVQRYLDRLRKISLDEIEKQVLFVDGQKSGVALASVFRDMQEVFGAQFPDFRQDLQRLQQQLAEARSEMFSGERISRSKLLLTDKVDLTVHTLIGEKPVPSCQSYKSDSSDNNFGLLSYLTDPNVKFIQIYDQNQNIIARAALRLLEDEAGAPVLFMERVYSVNFHPKIKEALGNFLQRKAEQMGVKYRTQEYTALNGDLTNEALILRSKSSRSPFVYSDAGGGKMADGRFEIRA